MENYFKDRVDFIDQWKLKYLLQTNDQQKYFWAYILAIVTKMKLIDIQYKSQLIAVFDADTDEESTTNDNDDDTKKKDINIDDDQLKQDKRFMDLYSGSLIPPNNIWNIPGIDTDRDKRLPLEWAKSIGKTTSLKSLMIKIDDKTELNKLDSIDESCMTNTQRKLIRKTSRDKHVNKYKALGNDVSIGRGSFVYDGPLYYQDTTKDTIYYFDESKPFKPSQTIFHEDEAVLLTFAEMVRKFVLESEHPDVQGYLWPWTHVYMYSKDREFQDQYLYLISKYNLSEFFEINEIEQLWKDYVDTEHKDTIDEANDDSIADIFDRVIDKKTCMNTRFTKFCRKYAGKFDDAVREIKITDPGYETKNIRHQRKLVYLYIYVYICVANITTKTN